MQPNPRKLELLAPARDCDIARLAILHGADAVYIGADAFGARAAATNSSDDIAALTDFAHQFNARVYVTLNTIIYDNELKDAENLVHRLYRAGVDALIVQDLSLLRMDIPPIALHASTQCDTRSPQKARFLEDCGFSQIVLARELSLDTIRRIADEVSVPLEVFVHGALCVSYSGDCQASYVATGRSANRGQCAQMCRLPYSLTDRLGNRVAPDAHYLSLRDMMRLDRLADLAAAGASSFKIEGRLKESDYVRNVVAAYSNALDSLVADNPSLYRRSSSGKVSLNFNPDVNASFNRRFTSYFLDGRPANASSMSSLDSPKWIGEPVATVTARTKQAYKIKAYVNLNNGDGLGYFDADRQFRGFRLNRVENSLIYPATPINIPIGATLFRNRDKKRDDIMASETARRTIPVDMMLRRINSNRISLRITDDSGISAETCIEAEETQARSAQKAQRLKALSKLGDTVYSMRGLDDSMPDDSFVAASVLTSLRRMACSLLDSTRRACYTFDTRRQEKEVIMPFKTDALDRHDNVANRLAEKFFSDHNIPVAAKAIEVSAPDNTQDLRVMTTRYCLRRELGACLRTPEAEKLPSQLFLRAPGVIYRLDFDCKNCCMTVSIPASDN